MVAWVWKIWEIFFLFGQSTPDSTLAVPVVRVCEHPLCVKQIDIRR